MHERGELEASQVRNARTSTCFQGFCQSHAPPGVRVSAGLGAVPSRARGRSSHVKTMARQGLRRRLRGKQAAPARQRAYAACVCGATRARVLSADGVRLCKRCFKQAIAGRTGHLAARVQLDDHSDGAVPRHGLNLH
eukprot:1488188-Karenia_brevis.AAC.1